MSQNRPGPEDILPTYDEVGPTWANQRNRALFERDWLDRFLALAPGPDLLDIGCGSGRPIAEYLLSQGAAVTGVDGAAAQCRLFARNFPHCPVFHADMRRLSLGERFHGLLAWDSSFHLSQDAQREMFARFAAHARPGAALLFTSGPAAGEAWGTVADRPVYHASLDPTEYRALLAASGFEVVDFRPEDPDCDRHTVWLARLAPGTTSG